MSQVTTHQDSQLIKPDSNSNVDRRVNATKALPPDVCQFDMERRHILRSLLAGGLGVSLTGTAARSVMAADPSPAALASGESSAGQSSAARSERSCIVIWLSGGPPQHETFDPKPEAPANIRGEFGCIETAVPGIWFSELLPRIAHQADKMCVLRSMVTNNYIHSPSGYWMLTGSEHPQSSIEIAGLFRPDDRPALGGLVNYLKRQSGPLPTAVTLPELMMNNPGVPWPGQDAGFLGRAFDPLVMKCDPNTQGDVLNQFRLPDGLPAAALAGRQRLLSALQTKDDGRGSSKTTAFGEFSSQAFELLGSHVVRQAFDVDAEPDTLRDKYGRHKFGQSCLLARRLVEAGVRLVHVNFPREPGDLTIGNPLWDTHSDNFKRCRNALCPPLDSGYSALLADLADRSLLENTLVVLMGEFGRSPQINNVAGREHWGGVFSVVLAGGGVRGGQVIGSSDAIGGQAKTQPFYPPDLTATILMAMGIEPHAEIRDRLGRPLAACGGSPLPVS